MIYINTKLTNYQAQRVSGNTSKEYNNSIVCQAKRPKRMKHYKLNPI